MVGEGRWFPVLTLQLCTFLVYNLVDLIGDVLGNTDVFNGNYDLTHVRVARNVVVFDGQLQALCAVLFRLKGVMS